MSPAWWCSTYEEVMALRWRSIATTLPSVPLRNRDGDGAITVFQSHKTTPLVGTAVRLLSEEVPRTR